MHAISTLIVPKIECQESPLSQNGIIVVTWSYIHTGGLNITQVYVTYSLDQSSLEFQQLPNGIIPVEEGADSPRNLAVRNLVSGNSYIFMVMASNEEGNSSTVCPSVVHDIGIQ